jgi:intraflagellar transport protein 46
VLTDLDTKLKAFVPEYIPAIGEVDAFLKMPRPDSQPEILGLYVLVYFYLARTNQL